MAKITSTAQLKLAVTNLAGSVKRAGEAAQFELGGFVDGAGRKMYPEGQEAKLRTEIQGRFDTVAGAARAAADDFRQQATERRLSAMSDPFFLLSTLQLQRANALLPLVAEFVRSAPLPMLAARLEAVAVSGGIVERLVYLRAAAARLEGDKPKSVPASLGDGPTTGVQPSGESGRLEFTQAFEALQNASIHPDQEAEFELAAALDEAAAEVDSAIQQHDPAMVAKRAQRAKELSGTTYGKDF